MPENEKIEGRVRESADGLRSRAHHAFAEARRQQQLREESLQKEEGQHGSDDTDRT